MRAQTNLLRIIHADTHRDLCDFKDQLLREDLAYLLTVLVVTRPKDGPAALSGLGTQSPPAQATGAVFGCCGKLRLQTT